VAEYESLNWWKEKGEWFMKTYLASSITRAVVFAVMCTPGLMVSAQNPGQPLAGEAVDDMKALAAKPTPKTADGHPDLNGRWLPPRTGARVSYGKVVGTEHQLIFGIPITGEVKTDAAVTEDLNKKKDERAKKREEAGPSYKPELVEKVRMMAKDPNHYDPTVYSCLPPGVPRLGAPRMILETPGLMTLLYGPSPYSIYRTVPTDGRPHRKVDEDFDASPMGDPVGHWEGDTFVIDSKGFDDTTWFGAAGYFHTDAMHVIERITRKGDTLEYSATVEDPNVLTKPFNLAAQAFKKGAPKDIQYNDDLPCDIAGNHDFRQHADHEHNIVD
jgi:hypothetical protein